MSGLSCQEELGPVVELVAGPRGEEGAAPSLICLLASGRACKVGRSDIFFYAWL